MFFLLYPKLLGMPSEDLNISPNSAPNLLCVCQFMMPFKKHCRPDGLDNRNLFSHSSRVWKSKMRLPAQPGSGESLLPGLQMANVKEIHCFFFFLYFHMYNTSDTRCVSFFPALTNSPTSAECLKIQLNSDTIWNQCRPPRIKTQAYETAPHLKCQS